MVKLKKGQLRQEYNAILDRILAPGSVTGVAKPSLLTNLKDKAKLTRGK